MRGEGIVRRRERGRVVVLITGVFSLCCSSQQPTRSRPLATRQSVMASIKSIPIYSKKSMFDDFWVNILQENKRTAYAIIPSFNNSFHFAPSESRAPLNSFTAVFTSSKFRADIAHLACFWALRIASSSVR